jgi:hypothetical protein
VQLPLPARKTVADLAADLWLSYGSLAIVIVVGVLVSVALWFWIRFLGRYAKAKGRRRHRRASSAYHPLVAGSAHHWISDKPSQKAQQPLKKTRIDFDTIVTDALTFFPGDRSRSCRGTVWFARFVSSELPAMARDVRAGIKFHTGEGPDLHVDGVWVHDWPNRAIEMSRGPMNRREMSFAPRQRKCLVLAVQTSNGPSVCAFNDQSHNAPSLERRDLHLPQKGTVGMTVELTAPSVSETFQFEFSVEDRKWTRVL